MQQKEQISGCVERIVFRNEENGWTVLDLQRDDGTVCKAVGVMPLVYPGLMLQAYGAFTEHPSFGEQFQVERYEQSLPSTVPAILRYLASGAVKGVGLSLAARIVQKFGADSLRILEEDPLQLAKIRGITEEKARKIGEAFSRQKTLRELIAFFAVYAIPATAAVSLYQQYGALALSAVRSDPYQLCVGRQTVSFEQADRIGEDMGYAVDDRRRVQAGVLYVLQHNLDNGHTCLPADRLLPTAAAMLGVDPQAAQDAAERLQEQRKIVCRPTDGGLMIHLPELYEAELTIARELKSRAAVPAASPAAVQKQLHRLEKQSGLTYHEKQRQAILSAACHRVFILTGGPGTGKTTTLRGIVRLMENMGEKVALAAPTGRAAKRITELTGHEAKTLHRLLEAQFGDGERLRFLRDGSNPVDADTLIIDEASMVDVVLLSRTLVALRPYTRVILVGDADQLPSVGPGSVLLDALQSGIIPAVQLTEVFRQAFESSIVSNAHRILCGQEPAYCSKTGDFFLIPTRGEEETVQTVVDLCTRRLPDRYGFTVFEGLQVLCPGRRGGVSTARLNRALQQAVNPAAEDKPSVTLDGDTVIYPGDKVIQTRNNYDIPWTRDNGENGSGVLNGDIGVLIGNHSGREVVTVRYDDRVAEYTAADLRDLDPAYAVTVHKSQGSEFEAVVLPLLHVPDKLCYRNLLYTAVTRARQLLIVVGSGETVRRMVQNARRVRRYTALADLLRQEAEP
ncbi:MAG: ATP-dependent RecD-like DNA helicase [Clostridia bacterium]|nr:ATP-dependent RecD-like DNA helicase [Clostridia bacterium]